MARLELVPATAELVRAELEGRDRLAALLGARVPESWPPDLYDRAVVEWTLARLEEAPSTVGWWLHYFVLLEDGDKPVLVGAGGYKGPPDADGTVEIGYSVLEAYRRRGLASEAVEGFVARAFRDLRVRRVIAETLPELAPSIGVLEKCGFRHIGEGSAAGVIRYERTRTEPDA